MKALLLGIILLIAQDVSAEKRWMQHFWIAGTALDSTITKGSAVFRFTVNNEEISPNSTISYSVDGTNFQETLDSTKSIEVRTTPGVHSFELLINLEYQEIFVSQIEIQELHRTSIILTFQPATTEMNLRKPVIYLYPEKEQTVSVKLTIKGQLDFSYPPYKDGWNVTALPNGTIILDEKEYNSLFWESSQTLHFSDTDFRQGSFVRQEDLLPFFETTLGKLGFTSQEKQDFITYWLPQMMNHSILYICYKFNEECDIFAELNIQPKPKQTLRLYMFWSIPEATLPENQCWEMQEIPSVSRDGFTVLEWGGAEIPSKN